MDVISQIKRLRRCDTPLVGVRTADPTALIARYMEANKNGPVIRWDSVQGLVGLNDEGKRELAENLPDDSGIPGVEPNAQTQSPVAALVLAAKFGESTMLWACNLHLAISEPLVIQAIANLRDIFRGDHRTLVLVGVDLQLPPELAQDILLIEEPMPSDDELREIIVGIYEGADVKAPKTDGDVMQRAVDALRGLSAFGAEQVAAMAMTPEGIDVQACWDQKQSTIEQVDGMTYDRSRPTFDEIGGLENVKTLGRAIISSQKRPALVVLLDEIEKSFGGLGVGGGPGDSSGTTQDALGVLLRWMEDDQASGIICVGPPGSGKSLFSRALGATGGIPSISIDLGAAKGSLVGESERKVRAIVRTIRGLSAGRQVFVVATCNRLSVLPPELRRRFRLGIVFFDLPSETERAAIWKLNLKRYSIKKQQFPKDTSWTGAEIRNCCELADQLSVSLIAAAEYIVPIAKAMSSEIQTLRQTANGKFLSASTKGTYLMPLAETATPKKVGRKVRTQGDA